MENKPATAMELIRQDILDESKRTVPPHIQAFADELTRVHAGATVLFYGSAMSETSDEGATGETVLDFYVLIPSYDEAFSSPFLRFTSKHLAPTVFYREVTWKKARLRAKYAVLEVEHFVHLCSPETLPAYFWARFCQPVRIVSTPDEATRDRVIEGLTQALITFVSSVLPLADQPFTVKSLWLSGLGATYSAELRPENSDRIAVVIERFEDRVRRLTIPALLAAGLHPMKVSGGTYQVAASPAIMREQRKWRKRIRRGKVLTAARVLVATFTFEGGVDYALWKIARHSGVEVVPTEWQRRHPFLAAPGLAFKVYRKGGFR